MTFKLYAERDAMALDEAGGYYCKHVSAMTVEGLHSKGDIAAELGFRDMRIDQLLKERDALAAESAGLKDLQPSQEMINAAHKEAGEYDNINLDDDLIVFIWQAMHSKLKTPATDAAIANIQAQGVERFAEKCSSKSKQAISSDTRDSWWLCGEHASDFAAQLRKEAGNGN